MARILIFVFLGVLFWLLFRVLRAQRREPSPRADASERPVEAMAQCAYCGAHVPTSQALAVADGRTYCSAAHRDAARAA